MNEHEQQRYQYLVEQIIRSRRIWRPSYLGQKSLWVNWETVWTAVAREVERRGWRLRRRPYSQVIDEFVPPAC